MRKNVLILGHNDATQFIDIYNQYTRLFDSSKYNVTVAYLSGPETDTSRARTLAENILFLKIPTKQLRGLKITAIKKLYTLCKQEKFDIVICHRYKPTYIMLWVSQFLKISALVFVMHELGTMSSYGRRLITGMLSRKNMVFAGVSHAVRDDMRKDMWFVPNNQIVTLYNVIDVDLAEPALLSRQDARAALHLSEEDFIFGNIARLAPNKDQETLIAAFKQMQSTCKQAKLVIMGNGELEETLKKQVHAHGLSENVLFTGFIPNAGTYMRAFDCFVLSSIQEAFGRVLLEAMIAKIPLIATRVHGIPEVVGDVGTLVPKSNQAALANELIEMYHLSDSARSLLGDRAYAYVCSNYSIPAFQKQFWQLPLMQSISKE